MKSKMTRVSNEPVLIPNDWNVGPLELEGTDLIQALNQHLSGVMEGILDPDIAGKKPDGYLNALQSGKFGDFEKRYIIAAYDDNKVVGILIGMPEDMNKLHIYSMGILSAYRKMGLGHALLAKCINDMLQRSVYEIVLDVHSENFPAFNLYKKLGFAFGDATGVSENR